MLRAMLDSHPDLAIPPESYFIVHLADLWPPESQIDEAVYLERLSEHERFVLWDLPIDEVRREFEERRPETYADAIRATFHAYARSKGSERWGDKTPIYVEHIDFLADLFPDARFIHLVRDGRDVALSFLERSWGPQTIEEGAQRWKARVCAGRRSGQALDPSRYTELRYEHLIDDAEGALRRVCEFVELPFDPTMLTYYQRANEVIAGTKYPEQHTGVTRPPTKGARDWRSQMTAAQVAEFEAVAGGLLGELGYELGT